MAYNSHWPKFAKVRNTMRRIAALRAGHVTFLDINNRVRAARNIREGEAIALPLDQLSFVKKVKT